MEKRKVVVIDDAESVAIAIQYLLETMGYEVYVENDGEAGIKKVFEVRPDLVILDINMPKMTGYEVVDIMRKEVSTMNTPILMMSGSTDEMDEIKGLELGVDGYITKPFNNELFIAKLKAILMRAQQNISVNPLTMLPGNIAINKEIEHRILSKTKFAVIYTDLNNFKSFNDYYGFARGDEVIKHTANILVNAIKTKGHYSDFVGHIGGDDFVVVCMVDNVENICETIIKDFDSSIINFYNEEEKVKGYIETYNRQGELKKFGIISISLSVVTNVKREIKHIGEISEISAELKSYVKQFGKSKYVIDRRAGT